MELLLGIDIGGTKLGIGLGDSSGKMINSRRRNNRNTEPGEVLQWIVDESKAMIAESKLALKDIAAFGISAPFPADAARGIMTRPTNNPKWRNVPILDYLKTHLQLDGCFENDANCGALAEWFFGAGKGCSDLIYLTLSTGIGGGIIAGSKLIRGGKALSAGELGHICLELDGRQCSCGMKGCYEAYCGGVAIANRVRTELAAEPDSMIMQLAGGDPEKIDMIIVEQAIRANDPYAVKLWQEVTVRNAQAFGMFINSLNPQKLILGTMAWAMGDLFMAPVIRELPRFCWQEPRVACELTFSALRRDIASFAGIAAALNYLREKR